MIRINFRSVMNRLIQVLTALLLVYTQHSPAQSPCSMPVTRAWIHITETSGFILDTLWFGFDTSATYGIDSSLCELEVPWPAPAGITQCDSRFLNIPSHSGQPAPLGLGNGVYRDFRRYVAPAQVDTHAIAFGASWSTTFTFHWSPSRIRAICDSAILVDLLTGGTLVRVPLHSADSLYATASPITQLTLFRYSAKQVQTGIETDNGIPWSIQLEQNYPNPFNTGTNIHYRLANRCHVALEVFDILGRQVATLVNRIEGPGDMSIPFNGNGMASGLYFYRLRVDDLTMSRRMILLR